MKKNMSKNKNVPREKKKSSSVMLLFLREKLVLRIIKNNKDKAIQTEKVATFATTYVKKNVIKKVYASVAEPTANTYE